MRSAIAVPIVADTGHLGFLTVYGREEEPPVTGADFQMLEAIADHAGPAIDAARQRGTMRRVPEGDALTGLETRHALHETLALEVARAHRHGRKLAVCVLDLDDFRRTNERLGQIAGDAVLTEVAGLLRETTRPEDLAFRSGGDEFAVIMPESARIDGEALYARLQGTLRPRDRITRCRGHAVCGDRGAEGRRRRGVALTSGRNGDCSGPRKPGKGTAA